MRGCGAGQASRPLPVLVELGFPGGRTGCRTTEEAAGVAAAVVAADSLRLAGVAGYEGGLGHDCSPAALEVGGRVLPQAPRAG